MARRKTKFWYSVFEHLSRKKATYSALSLCLLVGIVIGIIVELSNPIGTFFLSDRDLSVFDFVQDNGSVLGFFSGKLKNIVVAFLIIFCSNLSVFSSFLNFIFLVYQGFLFSSSCGAIISLNGFLGILNVVLILIPINAVLFICFLVASELTFSRAADARRYSINFKQSFAFQNFWRNFLLCFALAFVVCLIVSLVLPLLLKSVSFVAF